MTIGKTLSIDVGDEISIVCGAASINMRKDGTISINGKDISITAAGDAVLKAGKDVTVKGTKVAVN
jgi:type VI secretion system secreted protein VgrG